MSPARERGPLLVVQSVSKVFRGGGRLRLLTGRRGKDVHALRDVSLSASAGEVTALMGPNGAGKTTLMSIICDLIRPDSGSVAIDGRDAVGQGRLARQRIGLVTTDERSFFWRLSGRQNLAFFGSLQGLPRRELRRRVPELLEMFDLLSHADKTFRTYSAGMKKKLSLARALLNDPPVLLMDEPTTSLDPTATESLLTMVKSRILPAGRAIVWATHRLEELDYLGDRVVVLTHGSVAFEGTLSDLRGQIQGRDLLLHIDVERRALREDSLGEFVERFGARREDLKDVVRLSVRQPEHAPSMSELLVAVARLPGRVLQLRTGRASLHEVLRPYFAREESPPDGDTP